MSHLSIRNSIVAHVNPLFKAAYPNIPLIHDNAPFDWNSPPPVFVRFEVKFAGGDQAGMSADPKTRYAGFVYVTTYAREGTGSQQVLNLASFFVPVLGYVRIGDVQFQEAALTGSQTVKTFYTERLRAGFRSRPL